MMQIGSPTKYRCKIGHEMTDTGTFMIWQGNECLVRVCGICLAQFLQREVGKVVEITAQLTGAQATSDAEPPRADPKAT
jgi:hypothetical protein